MKARLATLIERESGGKRYMSGTLGDAVVILERDGETRDGAARWMLCLATPKRSPDKADRQHNRQQASWRMERRKAERVEIIGGQD